MNRRISDEDDTYSFLAIYLIQTRKGKIGLQKNCAKKSFKAGGNNNCGARLASLVSVLDGIIRRNTPFLLSDDWYREDQLSFPGLGHF
jgi:hypothetical protein